MKEKYLQALLDHGDVPGQYGSYVTIEGQPYMGIRLTSAKQLDPAVWWIRDRVDQITRVVSCRTATTPFGAVIHFALSDVSDVTAGSLDIAGYKDSLSSFFDRIAGAYRDKAANDASNPKNHFWRHNAMQNAKRWVDALHITGVLARVGLI